MVHVIVAPSSAPGVAFESRMFAPVAGVSEDPVCGTAHTLSTPYWMAAKDLSGVVFAKQVSAREGDLRIVFDAEKRRILLGGRVRIVCRGELYAQA
jgi:predicted PhzF superfamily epimerase YddE/YHI9